MDILFEDVLSDISDEEEQPRKKKVFKTRIDNLNLFDEDEFIDRFRVSKEVFYHLVSLIEDQIKRRTEKNLAVTPEDQVLLTLQYFASGSFMRCVGDMAGLHKSTVCRIIHVVSEEIAKLRPLYIQMPASVEDIRQQATKIFNIARFPKVLGTIDCTQVGLVSPGGNNAKDFRNRKGIFSLNVQIVGDADLCIQNIVARWPGSAHDSHIFNSSNLKQRLESGEFMDYWLLGDSGYGLQPHLLTPLANPQTRGEKLYNESHIRTRNTIERLFGVWKRRFPVMGSKIRCRLPQVQPIIVATAVLHNMCRRYNVRQPVDHINLINCEDQPPPLPVQPGIGVNTRQDLINSYFNRLYLLEATFENFYMFYNLNI